MGVKGLWSYVEHHNIQYAYPNKNARADCYGVNPRHLLVDMNAVMHIAYDAATPTAAATLRAVAAKVDELLAKVRPRETLVLVYDGVAPIAKLKTQKERRTSLSVHPPRPATSATARSSASVCAGGPIRVSPWYTCDPVLGEVPLHREEIVCGSEFVLACEEYVTAYLQRRKSHYSWERLLVCGCREQGEGEVKIAALLRHLWAATVANGSFSADDAVSLVGNDSDLILVAMAAVPFSYLTVIDPYDVSLTSLRELLDHWTHAVPNPPLPAELLLSYRVDFVFLMLLAGDDYYDGIRNDSVALWRRYRHLRANEGYFRRALVSGPHFELDLEFLRAVFARTGSMAAQLSRVPRKKRKTVKAQVRGGTGGGCAREGTQLLAAALWSMRGYVTGRCVDYGFLAHQEGPPSVGALRAAAQVRGLARKIGAGSTGGGESDVKSGSGAAASAAAAAAGEASEPRQAPAAAEPVFSPLEQCLAVLGIRGRFSMELTRAIRTGTKDDGHTLTTSTSISFVTETVRAVMAGVDATRLTEAERQLSRRQAPVAQLTPSDAAAAAGDEVAFMRLAAVPPRKTAAAEPCAPHEVDSAEAPPAEEAEADGDASEGDAETSS